MSKKSAARTPLSIFIEERLKASAFPLTCGELASSAIANDILPKSDMGAIAVNKVRGPLKTFEDQGNLIKTVRTAHGKMAPEYLWDMSEKPIIPGIDPQEFAQKPKVEKIVVEAKEKAKTTATASKPKKATTKKPAAPKASKSSATVKEAVLQTLGDMGDIKKVTESQNQEDKEWLTKLLEASISARESIKQGRIVAAIETPIEVPAGFCRFPRLYRDLCNAIATCEAIDPGVRAGMTFVTEFFDSLAQLEKKT